MFKWVTVQQCGYEDSDGKFHNTLEACLEAEIQHAITSHSYPYMAMKKVLTVFENYLVAKATQNSKGEASV